MVGCALGGLCRPELCPRDSCVTISALLDEAAAAETEEKKIIFSPSFSLTSAKSNQGRGLLLKPCPLQRCFFFSLHGMQFVGFLNHLTVKKKMLHCVNGGIAKKKVQVLIIATSAGNKLCCHQHGKDFQQKKKIITNEKNPIYSHHYDNLMLVMGEEIVPHQALQFILKS